MPFIGPLKERERHIPRSGDTQGEECRMPFIGPLKDACPSLCPQKARRHSLLKNTKQANATFFVWRKKTTKLWLPSKVTLHTRSIHTEPSFIGRRRISEIRAIPSSQLLAVFKHSIRRCKVSGIKIIIYINSF